MRLIDADALLAKWCIDSDFHNRIFDGEHLVKAIENAPTIEAEGVRHGKLVVEKVPYEKQLKKFTCSE